MENIDVDEYTNYELTVIRQIISNRVNIINDIKDCEKKNVCYNFNNKDSIQKLYDFLNIKNKKDIVIKHLHNKHPILISILQLEFDIEDVFKEKFKFEALKKEFKILQKDIKNTLDIDDKYGKKIISSLYSNYLNTDLTNMEIQLYLEFIDKSELDDENIEFNITDLQGSSLYPKMYKSLLNQLKTNRKFRQCIDEKLDIKNIHGYNEFMDDVKKKDFNINNPLYIKFIKDACDKFISLHPNDIKDCISKLPFSDDQIEVLKENICKGDIPFTMMDTITLVFRFIDIHIDIKNLNPDSIKILTKHSKEVLHKIITTSEYFEELNCNGMPSKITQNLKTMYNSLFDTHKSIEYPFKNTFKLEWFDQFNDSIFGKLILLIFICFIFAKIVDLFSGKDCCPQVPVNK